MTDPNLQNLPRSPESAQRSVEAIVKEWRQVAIAEGIAPTKVDQYLIDRPDVPEDVKEYLRKHLFEQGQTHKPSEVPPPPPRHETGVSRAEAQTVPVAPSGEQPEAAEIKGDVDMYDSKAEIESIKKEVIQPSETGAQVEADRAPEELPSVEPDSEETLRQADSLPGPQSIKDTDPARMGPISTGVYGYAPSEEVARNADKIAEKGPVSDAKTWQAVLLQRFLAIWGSFKGLFSE